MGWPSSYFLRYLVHHMFEMYSYDFTNGKFYLPTRAVYMSYLRQLEDNMAYRVQIEENNKNEIIELNSNYPIKFQLINRRISDKCNFFLKEGNYVTNFQQKVIAIPFNWTFVNKKDPTLKHVQEEKDKLRRKDQQIFGLP